MIVQDFHESHILIDHSNGMTECSKCRACSCHGANYLYDHCKG